MLIPFKYLSKKLKIIGIVHIGAHEAEEIDEYVKYGFDNVIWIEANPDKYEILGKKLKYFPKMILGKFAAGSVNSVTSLNISNNTQSSSILDLKKHKEKYKDIKYVSKKNVPIKKLDTWIKEKKINKRSYNFLNLDIQGFELEAFKGMKSFLENVDYIYTEVNFEYLYDKCCLKEDVDNFLSKYCFRCVAIKKTKYGWGDAIYTKRNFLYLRTYFFCLKNYLNFLNLTKKLIKKLFEVFK